MNSISPARHARAVTIMYPVTTFVSGQPFNSGRSPGERSEPRGSARERRDRRDTAITQAGSTVPTRQIRRMAARCDDRHMNSISPARHARAVTIMYPVTTFVSGQPFNSGRSPGERSEPRGSARERRDRRDTAITQAGSTVPTRQIRRMAARCDDRHMNSISPARHARAVTIMYPVTTFVSGQPFNSK